MIVSAFVLLPPSVEIASHDLDQAEGEDPNEDCENSNSEEENESLDDHGRARVVAAELLSAEVGKQVIKKTDGQIVTWTVVNSTTPFTNVDP
jgi:leucyl aminopeptidase (aminopeptidase T)